MKIRKLKSGNYNVRVFSHMENGKRIYKSFTAKNKWQIYDMVSDFKHQKSPVRETIGDLMDKYIELNEPSYSPTTINMYRCIRKSSFQDLMKMDVNSLTDIIVQQEINKELKRISRGKQVSVATVKQCSSVIFASIYKFTGKRFNVKFPKEAKTLKEYPEIADVYNAIKGSDIELPCMLALWLSFSMSEIRGLTPDSIRNGYIHIDKVMVNISGGHLIKERAKAENRNRKLKLPDEIFELIKQTEAWKNQSGYLVTMSVATIDRKLKKLLNDKGIYGLTFHSLRHLNASVMLLLGIPTKYAMERGGWQTTRIMQNVYQHTLSKEREIVDDKIDNYMKCIIERGTITDRR